MLTSAMIFTACASDFGSGGPSYAVLYFQIIDSTNPQLDFSNGFVNIDEFKFSGDRDNADDVYFTRTYSGGTNSTMTSAYKGGSVDYYDIPPGVYNHIELTLGLYPADGFGVPEMGLWVQGTFKKSDNSTVPVRVEIAPDVALEIEAISDTGPTITLTGESKVEIDVRFSPETWFDGIATSSLEAAPLTSVNGAMTLLISKEKNPDLYAIILTNIETDTKAVFN